MSKALRTSIVFAPPNEFTLGALFPVLCFNYYMLHYLPVESQPADPVKVEPVEVKEVVPVEEDSKYQRRRPVRRASKKMLQDHNPELVGFL